MIKNVWPQNEEATEKDMLVQSAKGIEHSAGYWKRFINFEARRFL